MIVCVVIHQLKIPYVHRIYVQMYGPGQPYLFIGECVCILQYRLNKENIALVYSLLCRMEKEYTSRKNNGTRESQPSNSLLLAGACRSQFQISAKLQFSAMGIFCSGLCSPQSAAASGQGDHRNCNLLHE